MNYYATDMAIKEMNENNITEKDILFDRVIIKRDLNPLFRLLNVETQIYKDNVYIFHPKDKRLRKMLKEICEINGKWILK